MAHDQVMSMPVEGDWALPPDASQVLRRMRSSAAGPRRRQVARAPYWVRAKLDIIGVTPAGKPMIVYTRDISEKGVGFIAQRSWLQSADAIIQLQAPSGLNVRADGYVIRCRQVSDGWYEGAIVFFNDQRMLRASEVMPTTMIG